MGNPLVEHLREGAADEGFSARVRRLATADYWRSAGSRLRQRPLARLFLGTTLAFACGVGLGVGVATVIAPEAAVIRGFAADLPAAGARATVGKGAVAGPVVAVRLRQEGGNPVAPLAETAGPPPVSVMPVAPEPAAEPHAAPAEPAAAITAPDRPAEAQPAVPIATTAREATPASAEASAPVREEAHISVPIGDVGPSRQAAPVEPVVTTTKAAEDGAGHAAAAPAPAEAGAPAADVPTVDVAMTGPSRPADAPVVKPVPAGSAAPIAARDAPVAAEAPVLQYQYEEKTAPVPVSELQVALGPAGQAIPPFSSAPQDRATDDPSAVTPAPRPAPKNLQLAALPMPRGDAWIRNAVRIPEKTRNVMIALIIDDVGIDQKRSRAVIGLPAPLTLSFIPYGYHLPELVATARAAGHEVMLHLPMEPLDADTDPGPNALRTTVTLEENRKRLLWAFSRLHGIVGLNNHMGSKFTTWRTGMEMVMQEVRARGMLFVDSFTNNESVGFLVAHENKLPSAARDVFIDHDISRGAIHKRLEELERIARRRGHAVGIGHPHDLTREALQSWIREAEARGVDFVPISYIVRQTTKSGS